MKREHSAASRFFIRIGQAGAAAPKRDEVTLPLFSLPLIMDCEGVLAGDARHLVNDEAEYLRRCRAVIRGVDLSLR
jgi:hypothetical protein